MKSDDIDRIIEEMITDKNSLRKAAEMALGALDSDNPDIQLRAAIALRQALAQSEQEPLGGEWVPCVKLPVIVHVRNQRDGETHISTREGITPVLPEDLIMRGVAGEEYPIGRELFERTYTFDVDAVNISQDCVDETAKGKHEWVGLTDEEIIECFDSVALGQVENDLIINKHVNIFTAIRSIEAKLKEKNT